MRSILFLILLVLVVSCEKKSGCYSCTTKFDVTHSDSTETVRWSVSDTQEFCDRSEEEILQYETDNTKTEYYVSGGVTTTTRTSTECVKQ